MNQNHILNRETRCTCKRTTCLKLYCKCFSAGMLCDSDCACVKCKNTPHLRDSDEALKAANKRRKRDQHPAKSCACKKGCLKKYCVCVSSGRLCSVECVCDINCCFNNPMTAPIMGHKAPVIPSALWDISTPETCTVDTDSSVETITFGNMLNAYDPFLSYKACVEPSAEENSFANASEEPDPKKTKSDTVGTDSFAEVITLGKTWEKIEQFETTEPPNVYTDTSAFMNRFHDSIVV